MSTELVDRHAALHAILREQVDKLNRVRAAQLALQHQSSLLADLRKAASEARTATVQ